MADINLNIALQIQEATASIKKFSDNANNALASVEKQSKETGKSISSIASSASITGQAIGTALGNLASGAISAAGDAAKKLFNTFITDGIRAYQEQEDAIASLNSALRAQGDLTKDVQASLLAQASALELTTKFSDEAVIGVQALITNLTDLDVNGIKKATESTLNFASAMGISTDTAARAIGKAIEGNTVGLSKYGVAIKKGANDTEQFNNVIQALEQRFNGAAEASAGTFSGSLEKLKNSFNGLQESTGSLIAQNPVIIASIAELARAAAEVTGVFDRNKEAVSRIISSLTIFAGQTVLFVVQSLAFLDKAFTAAGAANDLFAYAVLTAYNTITRAGDEAQAGVEEQFAEAAATRKRDLADRQLIFEEIEAISQKSLASIQAAADKKQEIANVEFQNDETRASIKSTLEQQRADEAAVRASEAAIKEIDILLAKNEVIRSLNETNYAEQVAANDKLIQDKLNSTKLGADEEAKIKDKQEKAERAQLNRKLDGTKTFFSGLASLSRTGNKELFAIGQAAALANAVVSGAQAFVNALAQVPYPFNIAAAAGIAVATGVEIATISAQTLATGITEVPAGFKGDTFPALLSSGERVLSVDQNKDLKDFIAQGGGGQDSGLLASIDAKLSAALNRPIVVTISGREIFRTVDDELISGRVFST